MALSANPSIIDLANSAARTAQSQSTKSNNYKWTIVRDSSIADDHENMPHRLDAPPIWVSAKIKKLRIHYHGSDMVGGQKNAEVYFNVSGGADGEPHVKSMWSFTKRTPVLSVGDGGFKTFNVDWPLFSEKPVRWDFWISTVAWEEDHGLDEEDQAKWERLSDQYLDILGDLNDSGRQPWEGDGSDYAAAGAALGHIVSEIVSSTSDDKIGEDLVKFDRDSLLYTTNFEFESDCFKGADVDCYVTYEVKRTQFIPIKPQEIYIPKSLATGVFAGVENYKQCIDKMIEYIAKFNSTFSYEEWQEFIESTKSDDNITQQLGQEDEMSIFTYFMDFELTEQQTDVILGKTLTHPAPQNTLNIYLDRIPMQMPAKLLSLQMMPAAVTRHENGKLTTEQYRQLITNKKDETVPSDNTPPTGMYDLYKVQNSPVDKLGPVVRWAMDRIKLWESIFHIYDNGE